VHEDTKKKPHDIRSPGTDMNWKLPEYEARLVTTKWRCNVIQIRKLVSCHGSNNTVFLLTVHRKKKIISHGTFRSVCFTIQTNKRLSFLI